MADQATASGLFPQFLFLNHVLNSVKTDVSSFTDLFNDPNAVHFAAAQAVFESMESITSSLQTRAAAAEAQTADAQSKINELKDTIEILKIAIRSNPQAPPRRKYLAAPEKFSGSEQDIAKRQDQYTAFRSAVNRCLTADYENESEFQKITFLASLLSVQSNLPLNARKPPNNQVADLKLKVSQELIDASVNRPNKPSAADIDAWTVWWQGIYDDLEEKTHLDNQRKNQGTNFNRDQSKLNEKKPVATSATITPDPSNDPMQLDAVRQSQHILSRYTRDQCLDLGLCLYCKEPGHIKTNCKEKRFNDAKYNTNSGTTLYPNRPSTTNQYAPNTHRFPVTITITTPDPIVTTTLPCTKIHPQLLQHHSDTPLQPPLVAQI
ncbi:hypothetical protein DID88_002283 [Monilinia fructigena]|uniref:CCHC-type domain-containing protein n=1 Tax=Monilinia fructigena TaxID=38457 RepID=A0A395IDF7_9HELO|nr:hypothetical protein DID88_002283 [Monilinia fructigena]